MKTKQAVESLYSKNPVIAALQLKRAKLYTQAMRIFPNSPKQLRIRKQIDELSDQIKVLTLL